LSSFAPRPPVVVTVNRAEAYGRLTFIAKVGPLLLRDAKALRQLRTRIRGFLELDAAHLQLRELLEVEPCHHEQERSEGEKRNRITFTLRLMETLETTRQVFSPRLGRFLSGVITPRDR